MTTLILFILCYLALGAGTLWFIIRDPHDKLDPETGKAGVRPATRVEIYNWNRVVEFLDIKSCEVGPDTSLVYDAHFRLYSLTRNGKAQLTMTQEFFEQTLKEPVLREFSFRN